MGEPTTKKPLTDLAVKQAKPREKVWCLVEADRTYRGLQLAIFPNGAKRWRFRFTLDGKAGLEGLGVYPDMSLAQAREACVRSRQLVQQGVKPTEHKKLIKHTLRVAKSHHFRAVAEQWFEWRKKKKNLDERNARKIWASLEKHAFPTLGHRPVSEIRPIECLNILEAMQKQNIGDQAKRILQRMKGIFDYAVTHQLIEHSPASSLKADDIIRAKPKHHPAMPLEAMRQFFDDLDNSNASIVSKLALRLQILTGDPAQIQNSMIADHQQNYCTAEQAKSGLCASAGPMAGKNLNFAVFNEEAKDGDDIYKAKNSFINNLVGLPTNAIPKEIGGTPAGQAAQLASMEKDAVYSIPIAILKEIQMGKTSTAKGVNVGISSMALLSKEVSKYGGNSTNYDAWNKVISGQNEHGLMIEILKIDALNLAMLGKQYRQQQMMEAGLASLVASIAKQNQLNKVKSSQQTASETNISGAIGN